MKRPFAILDCNNFWSPSGGGVRRYHLEKLAYFSESSHPYIFVMQDGKTFTEKINDTTFIEHIKAPKFRGNWDYRFLMRVSPLRQIINKHRPAVVEVGSPYVMPWLARLSVRKSQSGPALVSFWHADFPVTYIGRFFGRWGRLPGRAAEKLAWGLARFNFKSFQGFLVSSELIGDRMRRNGLGPIFSAPLGVNAELFHPSKHDTALAERLKAGKPERLTFFFPHRFMEEKGLRTLIRAYPMICQTLETPPALVFAGTGPDLPLVRDAAKKYPHVLYLGFIETTEEMARWYASCDAGLALSGHETFGLSILEAMASGQFLIGADSGAALEHVVNSGAGTSIPIGNPRALADAVANLMKIDREKASQAARKYAEQFTWANCFSRELEIYSEIIGKRYHN